MKKTHSVSCCFLTLCLLSSIASRAQKQAPDSTIAQLSKENGFNTYVAVMAEHAPLYNGYEFVPYGMDIEGFPWFQYPGMQKGSVYYDGSLFNNIDMHYDLVSDQVIIKDFTKNYFISLVGEKLKYFDIGEDHFVRMQEGNEFGLEKGFYHKVYEGGSTLLFRYKKRVQYTTNAEKTVSRYTQYNTYYVFNNGKYTQVSGKGDLVNAYRDKKNEIRKFISDNKLNFRKEPGKTMLRVAGYYDQLKKP